MLDSKYYIKDDPGTATAYVKDKGAKIYTVKGISDKYPKT
jgi:hypothetical protein